MESKTPRLGILVEIEEAFTHCAKAFLRSGLWDPASFVARDTLPSHGTVLRALQGEGFDAEAHDAARAERYARREGFY